MIRGRRYAGTGCRRALLAAVVGTTVAMVATAAHGAVASAAGTVFAGENAQHNLLVIQLNARGTRVNRVTWLYDATCVAGQAVTPSTQLQVSATSEATGIAISPRGTWKKVFPSTISRTDGSRVDFLTTVVGRRTDTLMRGTLRTVGIETDSAGGVVRTCDSGPVTFKIANRNIFGGQTAGQLNPIAVTMNAARTKVARLRWDWQAPCTLGPAARPETLAEVYYPDLITQLPVDSLGRFGGTFHFPVAPDPATGVTSTFDYAITARRTGQTIAGTITSTLTEVDTATGGEIRRCSSGAVTFTIRD